MAARAKDLADLEARSARVCERAAARAAAVRDGDEAWDPEAVDEDASYFVMKQEMLTSYCTLLSYYMLRKARGLSVRDHPVLFRLFELRVVFEKLRLLEPKLRHQLDKILSAADATTTGAPLRANAAALAATAEATAAAATAAGPADGADGAGLYRAPRHASARFASSGDGDGDSDDDDIDVQAMPPPPGSDAPTGERTRRNTRARRAEIARLIRADADQPELVGSGGGIDDAIGTGKKAANRDKKRKELKEQEKFEEDRFMRVDTNKKLKKKRKTTDFASSLDDLF